MDEQSIQKVDAEELLQGLPTGRQVRLAEGCVAISKKSPVPVLVFHWPEELVFWCREAGCNQELRFKCEESYGRVTPGAPVFLMSEYRCKQCERSVHAIAIRVWDAANLTGGREWRALKFGEWPFTPPLPSRLISVLGPRQELFFKGRRSELQGLGIGAYAYYRRAVEETRDRLFDEIIKAARAMSDAAVPALEAARNETQFSKALEGFRDSLPQSLMISGQNPMAILYSELSEGLHGDIDDDVCLRRARAVRTVLVELITRVAESIREHTEVRDALSAITRKERTT